MRLILPNANGIVRSRPIANSVRLTCTSVVSSVAIVESATAMMRILPPMPGMIASPSTLSTLPLLASMVLPGSITSVVVV